MKTFYDHPMFFNETPANRINVAVLFLFLPTIEKENSPEIFVAYIDYCSFRKASERTMLLDAEKGVTPNNI